MVRLPITVIILIAIQHPPTHIMSVVVEQLSEPKRSRFAVGFGVT